MDISEFTQSSRENISQQEFVLEYVAIFDGEDFETVLKALCNEFSLTIEDQDNRYLIASGIDFSIEARKPTSSYSNKVMLLTLSTDDEYGLQLAKEILEEYQELGPAFEELILLRDSVGEKRTREAYILLNELENMLRKIVVLRSAALSGKDWWEEIILKCLTEKKHGRYSFERHRNEEVNNSDITHQETGHHDIFFFGLWDLKKVIEEPENWQNGFIQDFKATRNIERLVFLNQLRRKIAHNRFLSQRNLDDLQRIHAQLMYSCRRILYET